MDSSDRDAGFTAFVVGRSGRLVHFATMLCGDPQQAEDLVQAALEKAYLRWERIESDDPFGYVRRAIVNHHLSWLRRRPWRERTVADVDVDARTSVRDHASTVDVQLDLLDALRALTRRQRTVVVLRFVEDLSEAETAAALGVAVGTVKATTSRTLAKLRVSLSVADVSLGEPT